MKIFSVLGLLVVGAVFYLNVDRRPSVSELPTVTQLRIHLAEHPHRDGHPEIILAAATPIAKVFEMAKESGEGREFALSYFKTCSEQIEIVASIRSVCHSRYLALK